MAAPQRVKIITRDHAPQFSFRNIQIYPHACLGTGAYGAVCKAMCDELPCAAKILHSALFQYNDPGMPAMTRRFQQECELMGRIRHPCIVQYLGTVQDPETRRPILLMELMDESLTKFLERSTIPLAYHLQVNISYDIALALAYLHSNGVVHRDLSSNNVLVSAGSRAKVTDFGMLKLLGQNMRTTPLTTCPGTLAYMPLEALSDEPEYTDKLDCFSAGVLMIQIVTRKFPEPTKAMLSVRDCRYPTGQVLVPVPEVERRKKDIDSIDDYHPLKEVSLSCLKDVEGERPSAQVLCHQLARLREADKYRESVHESQHSEEGYQTLKIEHDRLVSELQRVQTEKEKELAVMVSLKDREIKALRQQLQKKVNTITPSTPQKQRKLVLIWEEGTKMNCRFGMIRGAVCARGNVVFFNPGGARCVCLYNYQTKQWGELPKCPTAQFALVVINDQLTIVGGRNSNKLFGYSKGQWEETFPPMSTNREFPAAVCTGHYVVVAGGRNDGQPLASVEVMDTITKQWFTAASLPRGIHWASMTVCGDYLYLLGDGTTEVHYCSLRTLFQPSENPPPSQQVNVWMKLEDLPVCVCTAVTLCGQLVGVGGGDVKDNKAVDDVYCHSTSTASWKLIGRMPSKQSRTLAATLPGDKLIVVTGVRDIRIDIASCVMSEM